MSPTSYQLLYPAIYFVTKLVPVAGLEPAQYCYREILSLLCLPFHHTGGDWQGLEYHIHPRMSSPLPEMTGGKKIFSFARFPVLSRAGAHRINELRKKGGKANACIKRIR
jgi:hypothetical protein